MQTDQNALYADATAQGNAAGTQAGAAHPYASVDSTQADWGGQYSPDGTAYGSGPDNQGNYAHKAGMGQANARPTTDGSALDPTTLAGYGQFQADQAKAADSIAGLTSAGSGHNSWEQGLLGADTGYQASAKALQGQLNGFSSYLDGAHSAYVTGFNTGAAPLPLPAGAGDLARDPNETGPVYKPQRNRRTEQP